MANQNFLKIILSLFLGALLAFPASVSSRIDKTFWRSGYEHIKIVSREGDLRNDHPTKILSKKLQHALRSIYVMEVGAFVRISKKEPLLSEAKANKLGKLLAAALLKTNENEDILFRVGDNSDFLGGFVERSVYTAGRVFWYKNRLHIIFGGIKNVTARRMLLGQPEGTIGEPDIGSRSSKADLSYEVVANPGIRKVTKARPDWVVINLGQVHGREVKAKKGAKDLLETRIKRLKRLRAKGLLSKREYRERLNKL